MSIDYRAVFGRSEIFSFGYIGFLLPHRSSFGAAMSAGLPTDSCFTGAVARSFSLPVLYRRKHDWKYCLNAITKQIGTAAYVVSITEAWMTPTTLLVISFLVCKKPASLCFDLCRNRLCRVLQSDGRPGCPRTSGGIFRHRPMHVLEACVLHSPNSIPKTMI